VALNWLVRQPGVMVYLTSLNPQHLQENLAALDLELLPDEVEALDHLELPEEALWPE
jgi:diketogulonate reductase-like aldo/keto reductase